MQNPDSFDRIIHYMKALACLPFKYGDKVITPNNVLQVGSGALRSYTCPEGCGACCMKCSLIFYISDQPCYQRESIVPGVPNDHPIFVHTRETEVVVNDKTFYVIEDSQTDNRLSKCRYLGTTGRCGIYDVRPLPCRIELFKFSHKDAASKSYARVTTPGRKWALQRVDGGRGALCELTPYDQAMTQTHIRDLKIIQGWMDAMGISNRVPQLIQTLKEGPTNSTTLIASLEQFMGGK